MKDLIAKMVNVGLETQQAGLNQKCPTIVADAMHR